MSIRMFAFTNRFFRIGVLVLLIWGSVIAPARAILPVLPAVAAVLTTSSAATNAAAALTVGTIVGMVWLKSQQGASTSSAGYDDSFMSIPLGTRTSNQLPTPAGWSGPTSPPSVTGGSAQWRSNLTGVQSADVAEVAASVCSFIFGSSTSWDLQPAPNAQVNPSNPAPNTSPTVQCYVWQWNDYRTAHIGQPVWKDSYAPLQSVESCPSGYSMSGGSCVLTQASSVQKPSDNRCDVLASVSGFTMDPQDPDCGAATTNPQSGITTSPGKVSAKGANGDTIDVIVDAATGVRTVRITRTNANGTTTTQTITTIPAQNGQAAQITGTSSTTVAGTGSLAGTGTAPAFPDFPTDYNREVTQQGIKTTVDSINQKLDVSGQDTTLSGSKTALDTAFDSAKTNVDNISQNWMSHGWSWPVPEVPAGGGCQPLAMSYKGNSAQFDWCPSLNMLRDVMGWLAYVFTSLWLLRLFSRTVRGQ